MEYFDSVEIDAAVDAKFDIVARATRHFFARELGKMPLADLNAKIRYIPVVMNEDGRQKYKARSRLERKTRIYNCCPQLNFEVFVSGSFNDQLSEYLRGLEECISRLPDIGASEEQVAAFEQMLHDAFAELSQKH